MKRVPRTENKKGDNTMLLAVNVGNRRISFAVFDEYDRDPTVHFEISTDLGRTVDEYTVLVSQLLSFSNTEPASIDGAVMSSVVPQLNETLKKVIFALTGKLPLSVGPGVKTEFAIRIDDPAELGADIVANVSAAVRKMKCCGEFPRCALILDMGTATTLFAINKTGELIGGAILPGADISLDALHRETAQLPNIEMRAATRAVGRNTRESLISGVVLGQATMIDGLADRMEDELGCGREGAICYATGEYFQNIADHCRHRFIYDEFLTVSGLASIYKNTLKQ